MDYMTIILMVATCAAFLGFAPRARLQERSGGSAGTDDSDLRMIAVAPINRSITGALASGWRR